MQNQQIEAKATNKQQSKFTEEQELIKTHLMSIHSRFYQPLSFIEIQHLSRQHMIFLGIESKEQFLIQQSCLLICYDAFQKYYDFLMNSLRSNFKQIAQFQLNEQKFDKTGKNILISETNIFCDILLSMNGENDKAWNIKKLFIIKNYLQEKEYFERQLRFNAIVCLKNKKSSSYYQYRIQLIEKIVEEKLNSQQKQSTQDQIIFYQKILQTEHEFLCKVLSKFYRNYYAWMYRVKLLNLLSILISSQQHKTQTSMKLIELQSYQHGLIHKFISKNNNDHSAFSYLVNLFNRILSQSNNLSSSRRQFQFQQLKKQKEWITQLLDFCRLGYEDEKSFSNLTKYSIIISNKMLLLDQFHVKQKK